MGLFGLLNEEQDKFIPQLIAQAKKTNDLIIILEKFVNGNIEVESEKTDLLLTEIKEIRSVLIDDLHNTFITPIDREDIYNISNALFDMVDYGITTIEEMNILKVKPDEFIKDMISLVQRQMEELNAVMQRLSKNPRIAGDHVMEAKRLEKKVEKIYRNAIKALFEGNIDLSNL
ncbi:MAG: DUF47 family protein [Bacteroidetes bacterium]|nr:DUF47 family protein [Bacteroidota bacterium]